MNGGSLAYAQATAIAEAYAQASAVAQTCHKCFAATELIAVSYEKIFINATSVIDARLQGVAAGGHAADTLSTSANAFLNVTVVALAEVCNSTCHAVSLMPCRYPNVPSNHVPWSADGTHHVL